MNLIRDSIYVSPKPEGDHWDSVPNPESYLLELIERMDAALRLARGTDNETVLSACRQILYKDDPDEYFDVFQFISESFALDAYEMCRRRGEEIEPVSYTLVLGTGGPHVELSDDKGHVALTIWWGGEWRAASCNEDDTKIFEDFFETFYKYE